METKTPQEATREVIKLKSLKKEIDEKIKELESYLMQQMTAIGVNSFPFDFAKATIVTTTKTQIIDEHKVIEKIREIGMYDEYVEPRLKDIFSVKDFIKEYGIIDGITQYESEPYVKITSAKE